MSEWPQTTLGDAAVILSGFPFRSADFLTAGGAYRLLRGDNIGQGRLRWDGAKWFSGSLPGEIYELAAGDVVLAMDRPWVGAGLKRSQVRAEDLPALLVQRVARLRGSAVLDQGYLACVVSSREFTEYILGVQTGTAVPHISGRQIAGFRFALPPIEVQRAIADVLGALDDKIAANARLAATADQLAASIVRRAVNPAATLRLGEIAEITMGSSPTGDSLNEVGDGVVFYQGVRDFGMRYPTRRIWTTSPTRSAAEGDILVSVRAPVGDVNIANERLCIGRGLAAVRSRTGSQATLFHLLRHDLGVWEPYEAEGTVFGSINRDQLHGIRVPALAETSAAELEETLSSLEERIAAALREMVNLATTRDALLPALMSGRLTVRDAEVAIEAAV